MSSYRNKKGTAVYTVIADTHGYTTGCLDADFDLGDNTTSNSAMHEPIQPTMATKFTLLGNHDVAQIMHEAGMYVEKTDAEITVPDGKEWCETKVYADEENKILFLGLESAKSFHSYTVPDRQIIHMAQKIAGLPEDWDAVIMTHVPLFPPRTTSGDAWNEKMEKRCDRIDDSLRGTDMDTRSNYMGSAREIVRILSAFQTRTATEYKGITYDFTSKTTNHIIGCFCGHIHNTLKCAISLCDFCGYTEYTEQNRKKIYMEAFRTNGSADYTPKYMANAGMYIPDPSPCKIEIDFDAMTVNGTSYISPAISADYIIGTESAGHPFSVLAKGEYKLSEDSEIYPKFYEGKCIGWGLRPEGGATRYGDNIHDVHGITVEGIDVPVAKLRFSASGQLKYYVGIDSTIQKTIPDYDTAIIRFVTDNNVKWHFEKGLFVSAEKY